MRIVGAKIFGFGKWIDQDFDFQQASLISFYGKNEAGKSTLQHFFHYMFFGLPPRKLAKYQPKTSRQIGGRLNVFIDEIGEVMIERVEQDFRMCLPNGEVEKDEARLTEYLHGLNEASYRAIYGFSSLDLMQLHQMKEADLSDLLFSVSLTGSPSIYHLERRLARQLDERFKKAGRKPVINEQIQKVTELSQSLVRMKKEVASYRHLIEKRDGLVKKITNARAELEDLQAAHAFNEKLLHFLPQIRKLQAVRDQLSLYQGRDVSFPENGIERYEWLRGKKIPIEAEKQALERTIAEYEKTILQLRHEGLSASLYQDAKLLLEREAEIKAWKEKKLALTEAIHQLTGSIRMKLQTLYLDEADLEDFQPAFHLATTWKQLVEEGKQLQAESASLEDLKDSLERKRKEVMKEKERVESEFVGFERLQQIRDDRNQRAELKHQWESFHSRLQWEKQAYRQAKRSLLLTTAISILLFFLYLFTDQVPYLSFAVLVLAVAGQQGYVLWQSAKQVAQLKTRMKQYVSWDEEGEAPIDLQAQESLASDYRHMEQLLKELQIEALQIEEKQYAFAMKEHQWIQAVETERARYPFLKQTELEFWPEILQGLEEMKALHAERESLEQEVQVIEAGLAQFAADLSRLAEQMGLAKAGLSLEGLKTRLQEEEARNERLLQYQALQEEAGARLAVLNEEIQVIEKEMQALFEIAHVEDEEMYYELADQIQEYQTLHTASQELSQQLSGVFKGDLDLASLDKEIDEYDLEKKVAHLTKEIEDKQSYLQDVQEEKSAMDFSIEQLESSDDYSYMTHLYESEKDRLNELAEEWALYKLAQSLLQAAKWAYQKRYMKDVMTYTTSYFRLLTANRYQQVYPPTEKDSFQVETANQMRYRIEELSKGTIDQLYVALRFAISKVMSEKFVVPFMIDDAFVHFDEERAGLAVELLEKISQEQQVIVYTCRQQLADEIARRKSLLIRL